jgi:hypothetical protein
MHTDRCGGIVIIIIIIIIIIMGIRLLPVSILG